MMKTKLFTTGNPKTVKGEKRGYLTFILHLAPADLSGYQVCPKATAGCKAACLNTAGRGGMFRKGETTNVIQQARIRKTKFFFEDRPGFMTQLYAEIQAAKRYVARVWPDGSMQAVFRLNGTSDIAWEKIRVGDYRNLMEAFPNDQFYDYTKIMGRKVPANYHLTFSQAESNDADVYAAFLAGMNVAVVFHKDLPVTYGNFGRPVINGDEHDLRFLDPSRVVIGLKAKGRAKKDTTGFVKIYQRV